LNIGKKYTLTVQLETDFGKLRIILIVPIGVGVVGGEPIA
jgi:hypothetical protein